MTGRTLVSQQSDHSDNIQIDLSKLPGGLYFVKIASGQYTHIYKIVKQ